MADERNPVPPPGDGPQQPESASDQTSTFDPFVDDEDDAPAMEARSAADTDPDATGVGGGDGATGVGGEDPDATRIGTADPDATRVATAAAGTADATRKVTPQPWAARASVPRVGADDDADL